MIRIRGLQKFFNKGRQNEIHVIHDVSMDLPEKGMVAVFGKSGCGKTTLLNVIGGLDRYAEGTVTVEGQDLRKHTDTIRNRFIGYIFQNYNLNPSESCFENVADALRLCGITDPDIIESRVTAALANVGMEKYGKRMPDTLSGGQQQRIAIARAIVKNPRIVLADEPTGNLDEANTVMVMNLLKAIAKDHLVLLVTHEANLVDYYCDTVVELSDGKIAAIRQNSSANGFAVRDKNEIWLGEMDCRSLCDEHTEIEYYGEKPQSPIRLKIVNQGGNIYLRIDTDKVRILDEFSEIKLRDGVYEEREPQAAHANGIDMSQLPPIEGTRFGCLFSLKSSVKSGYAANFHDRKKGQKILRRCMCLFAVAMVLMSAIFGTSFGKILNAKDAYNHNVFYLYTPNADVSEQLGAAVGDEATGIDFIRLTGNYPSGDVWAFFRTGTFETFDESDYDSNFKTNAVYLDVTLAQNLKLVEGKKENLSDEEILISTKVADALLEKSTLGFITERKDLLGLVSTMFTVDGKSLRIAGIVESSEPAVYLTELAMAKYVSGNGFPSRTALASDYGLTVNRGEAILAIKDSSSYSWTAPSVGTSVRIQGREIQVTEIKRGYTQYADWLAARSIFKSGEERFFRDLIQREHPELSADSVGFDNAVQTARNERFYEYYDYYYAEVGDWLRDVSFFDSDDLVLWLYTEKGVEEAKYAFLPEEYYQAVVYKERYGSYPTKALLQREADRLPSVEDALQTAQQLYENTFYAEYRPSIYSCLYLVNEIDYIAFSKQLGETHSSAMNVSDYETSDGTIRTETGETVQSSITSSGTVAWTSDKIVADSQEYYTVIHSSDPKKTQAWLTETFATLQPAERYRAALITPDDIFDDIVADNAEAIVKGLITLAVLLMLMSLCMFFIMRSSLLNRIKEIGIYRAIGVSKKNLMFKFLIEAAVLTTLTVFVGYLLTSVGLSFCLGMSSLVSEFVYYPLWLAGAVLLILYGISLFFGVLPIVSLLRKTPSEILAQYDI